MDASPVTLLVILIAFVAGGAVGYKFGASAIDKAFETVNKIQAQVDATVEKLKSKV